MIKILVCGGRNFNDKETLYGKLDKISRILSGRDITIIHGAARGADSLANDWATDRKVQIEAFPADWNRHGKAAGPIRNQQMLTEGKPDVIVAFSGGSGTAHMISIARKAGIPVYEVK